MHKKRFTQNALGFSEKSDMLTFLAFRIATFHRPILQTHAACWMCGARRQRKHTMTGIVPIWFHSCCQSFCDFNLENRTLQNPEFGIIPMSKIDIHWIPTFEYRRCTFIKKNAIQQNWFYCGTLSKILAAACVEVPMNCFSVSDSTQKSTRNHIITTQAIDQETPKYWKNGK